MSDNPFTLYFNGAITKEELHALVDETFNGSGDRVFKP